MKTLFSIVGIPTCSSEIKDRSPFLLSVLRGLELFLYSGKKLDMEAEKA
jgi:hypothetical protein